MFTTTKPHPPSAQCSPSSSSPTRSRPPFVDITNHAPTSSTYLPSSPVLPSLEHGIPSSSPGGGSLPRTPGRRADVDADASSSSPAFRTRGALQRGLWHLAEGEDEDEQDENELVAGVLMGGGRKRARLESGVSSGVRAHPAVEEEEVDMESRGWRTPVGASGHAESSAMGMMDFLSSRGKGVQRGGRARMGLMGAGGLASGLSTLDYYPSTLVTSHSDDLYRMPSFVHEDFAPVFVCQYSNEAKRGGRQMMALGSEEGGLEWVDAGQNAQWDREHTRKSFRPHENAIFDLKWSADDTQIVTSSGAQTSLVLDVESERTVATLRGHTSSVKTTIWDPSNPNILASAARDGHINIYDLRDGRKTCELDQPKKLRRGLSSSTGGDRTPVTTIKHAHYDPSPKTRKPLATARTATRSPTSILYTPQRAHTLVSAGTGDGILKLWDLRTHGSHATKANAPAVAAEQSYDPTGTKGRSRGVASLCLSNEGDRIFALGTDNKIYTHSPLALGSPSFDQTQVYSHPDLKTSFYTRLSLSSCGRYLISGSTRGAVHLFEVGGSWAALKTDAQRRGIVLKADEGGREIGCVDWGGEGKGFASVSDELNVRVWKSNQVAADWLKTDRRSAEWSWGGRADWD